MKIAILGSGGREHAIAYSISKSKKINKNKSSFEITKFVNQILEKMILKNIDQWIWTHDRWKN